MARSLQEWLALQQSTHPRSIDLGLARVREVAQRLGLLPFPAQVITVAGTNGKGSTVAHLEALLLASGVCVGAFTSPHLLRYNERVRVAGLEASDAELVVAFDAIEAVLGEITLTYFEYGALAALYLFRDRGVRVAVLEVGLGGRLDAVNIVDADVAIITSIGFDHCDWLGDTLEAIGAEKAGVLRAGKPAVLAGDAMPASVIMHANHLGARLVIAGRDYRWRLQSGGEGQWQYMGGSLQFDSLPPSNLPGAIQTANAAAAIAALEVLPLQPRLSLAAASQALRNVRLPGRFQRVQREGVEWILDVAHNEPAAQVLAANLAQVPCAGRTLAVTSILKDKDIDAIARALDAQVQRWIVCSLGEPRGLAAEQIIARSSVFGADVQRAPGIVAGLEQARALACAGDRIVVFGSFLTVAPALEFLEG